MKRLIWWGVFITGILSGVGHAITPCARAVRFPQFSIIDEFPKRFSGEGKTILVTGATGFIGRNVVLSAIAQGYAKIIVLVRDEEKFHTQLTGENLQGLALPEIQRIVWNSREVPAFEADHVVHCAGRNFGRFREDYEEANIRLGTSLLESTPQNAKIVSLSSQAAGGAAVDWHGRLSPRMESDSDAPVTFYGESKLEMEGVLKSRFTSRQWIVLRPPMVLGARDTATLQLFNMVRSHVGLKVGYRSKYYSFVNVRDLVDAIFTVLHGENSYADHNHGIFYVASADMITDRELISTAAEASNKWILPLPIPQPVMELVVAPLVDTVPKLREANPTLTRDRARDLWLEEFTVEDAVFRARFHWGSQYSLRQSLDDAYSWYQYTDQIP